MNKGINLAFFLCAFLLAARGAYADFEDAQSLTLDIEILGHATIREESSRATIQKATVNLTLFPRNDLIQEVESITFIPQASVDDDVALFTFQNPSKEINYLVKARIETGDSFVSVSDPIPFPLESIPQEIKPYVEPTEIIDSDDEAINRIASDLIAGEDDLYSVVFELAKWTRENVNYNLSSVTADVSQKASWVLLERKGVCDEITSLFIAMLRSLGIPAKFITGYAYTNSPLFPENWGAHGWAEVYFPGVGWVPFDITYGQFGWVDSTHIKLKESADPNDASTRYEWIGRDVELTIEELKTTVDVRSQNGKAMPFIQIQAAPLKNEIGFGSYNAIEAKVSNLRDSSVMAELSFGSPREVVVIGKRTKDIMLLPREERSVYWIVRLEGDLEDNYLYTFPISVQSSRNASGKGLFSATSKAPIYDLREIGNILDQREEEEEKIYSSNVALNCTPSEPMFYAGEKAMIRCLVSNTGNTPLDDLLVCLGNDCESIGLGITKEYGVEFPISTKEIGMKDERVTAKNGKVSRAADVSFEIRDPPAMDIFGIEMPVSARFEQSVPLSFSLGKLSYSDPQNVKIDVLLPFGGKGWTIEKMTRNQSFTLTYPARNLRKGENQIRLIATYGDGSRRFYQTEKIIPIALTDITLGQQLELWARDVDGKMRNLGTFKTLLMVALAGIAFMSLVIFIFRKRPTSTNK